MRLRRYQVFSTIVPIYLLHYRLQTAIPTSICFWLPFQCLSCYNLGVKTSSFPIFRFVFVLSIVIFYLSVHLANAAELILKAIVSLVVRNTTANQNRCLKTANKELRNRISLGIISVIPSKRLQRIRPKLIDYVRPYIMYKNSSCTICSRIQHSASHSIGVVCLYPPYPPPKISPDLHDSEKRPKIPAQNRKFRHLPENFHPCIHESLFRLN